MTRHAKLVELEIPPKLERAIFARLALPGDSPEEVEESLAELGQLAWTAGAVPVQTFTQRKDTPHPGTHFGEGKVEEIKAAVAELEADVVIVDSDLTPRQGSKLETLLGCKVIDRTQLILDIFAQRAQTHEGKLQVELAQLQYLLPRLAGRGSVMRQQGGIGVRGPGEQKLEVDRRVIRNRIERLRADLESVRNARQVQRKRRNARTVGLVALAGYTNAGKSSLLNALTNAHVLAEDKLFATLDPRVRKCALPSGRDFLLADTVGFIRKLPHGLVAAFRATLEEVAEADLILLVLDAAHPAMEEHLRAVKQVLEEIGASEIPIIKVFNKVDRLSEEQIGGLLAERGNVAAVSAHTGRGLPELLAQVDTFLEERLTRVTLRIPHSDAAWIARVHQHGRVLDLHYDGDDVVLDAELDATLLGQLAAYVV